MNRYFVLACISLFMSLGLLSSIADAQSTLPAGIAAKVNGVVITESSVVQLARRGLSQGQALAPQQFNAAKQQLINIALLSEQATKSGLEKKPQTVAQLAQIRANYLADAELVSYSAQNPVTEDEMRAEYDRQMKILAPDGNVRQYHLRDIVLPTESEAYAVLGNLQKKESFEKLAKTTSIAFNREKGGDLGWVSLNQLFPAASPVVASLKNGGFSTKPLQGTDGWYIFQVQEQRTSKPPSYDELKDRLRIELIQMRQYAYITKLRASAKIEQ